MGGYAPPARKRLCRRVLDWVLLGGSSALLLADTRIRR